MNRSADTEAVAIGYGEVEMKTTMKVEDQKVAKGVEAVLLDENLLYEVLKHVDAGTLAASSCVSKQWRKTAEDERLWEMIWTEGYPKNSPKLRAVVLALGVFRRLYLRRVHQMHSTLPLPPGLAFHLHRP